MYPPNEIIVTVDDKKTTFEPRLWRRAIDAYLDAVWAEDPNISNTTLVIRGIELKRQVDEYNMLAWANAVDLSEISPVNAGTINKLVVTPATEEVEIGLARLARSQAPLALVIRTSGGTEVHIWVGTTKPGYGPILATKFRPPRP